MCYDIKTQLQAQLRRAKRRGDPKAVEEIGQKLLPFTDLPLYHSSGFEFPRLLIYTQRDPWTPVIGQWGLLPHWVQTVEQKKKIRVQTLNARWETIFEKPSFRWAARSGRCLIGIDGFYEHFHHAGRTYPYFVNRKDGEPIYLAGVCQTTEDPEDGEVRTTFSIVTVRANRLMTRIHNNPRANGSRMPLILGNQELEDRWLAEAESELLPSLLEPLAQPLEDGFLRAYTVGRLRGKEYRGNQPNIADPLVYEELEAQAVLE